MNKSKRMLHFFEVEKEQYSPKVDKIIYSNLTSGFTEEDWIALGIATLDQAGFPAKEVDNFVAKFRK